jgi:hypothetical protein
MRPLLVAALLLIVSRPAGVFADEALEESRGRSVRVRTATGRVEGRLTDFDDATVWVEPKGASPRAIPRTDVELMEVRRGKGWHVAYISMGAGGGLMAGMTAAVLGSHHCGREPDDPCPSAARTVATIFGPAVVGGVIVGLATINIWEDVEMGPATIGLRPVPQGAAVRVSIRF